MYIRLKPDFAIATLNCSTVHVSVRLLFRDRSKGEKRFYKGREEGLDHNNNTTATSIKGGEHPLKFLFLVFFYNTYNTLILFLFYHYSVSSYMW